jgi:hypothetical protein
MNIDQTFLINKINQLCERVSLLERKIQQYEGNNLQTNNFYSNNFLNNNILHENVINKKLEDMCINKREEENKIYDPLSIEVKNNVSNKQKNILFTNNNARRVVEVNDKIYDPLSS